MKSKAIKIIVIAAVFAFFSAGVSIAQDRRGGRQNNVKAKAYTHYKQAKNHKFEHSKNFKKFVGHTHYSKHYSCPQCRPVVVHNYHRHYSTYRNYRPHTGIFWNLSVVDPNVAFSFGVVGR